MAGHIDNDHLLPSDIEIRMEQFNKTHPDPWSNFLNFMKDTYYIQADADIKDCIELESSLSKALTIWVLNPEQEKDFEAAYTQLYFRLVKFSQFSIEDKEIIKQIDYNNKN